MINWLLALMGLAMAQEAARKRRGEAPPMMAYHPLGEPLPPFPESWELDDPFPAVVKARAAQLLPTLYKQGKAWETTTEQTGGRWITYQATNLPNGKHAVLSWRLRSIYLPPFSATDYG